MFDGEIADGIKNRDKLSISDLFNLSINSEKFPDSCKVAKLRPLYKKGSLTQPCNYRPISLLPLISKVIEKVIHDQTSTFLNSKQLLYTYQSGFWKKHSTDFCLSYQNDKILKDFDKGLMTGKRPLTQLIMMYFWKNYMLLVSRNILC